MGFKILRTGSPLNLLPINRFPHFYNKDLMSITKSKNGFADYPDIPRTGLHEPVRATRIPSLHIYIYIYIYIYLT